MAKTIFLQKVLGSLRPVDAMGEAELADLPDKVTVKAVITQPRNGAHHRKFFALLNVIYPHQDQYTTHSSFLAAIKVALGYGETVKLDDGRTVLVPGSISFGKMDQTAFEEFYNRAMVLICERIVPGINRRDVEREVSEIMAGREAA